MKRSCTKPLTPTPRFPLKGKVADKFFEISPYPDLLAIYIWFIESISTVSSIIFPPVWRQPQQLSARPAFHQQAWLPWLLFSKLWIFPLRILVLFLPLTGSCKFLFQRDVIIGPMVVTAIVNNSQVNSIYLHFTFTAKWRIRLPYI